MSDVEQAALAAALAETLSPLAQAAQARQEAEHAEWQAGVSYQALKHRYRALLERIAQLQQQEQTAQRKENVLRWRAERQALEHDRVTLGAELSAADEARKQANARMIAAQHAHTALCETASRLYLRLKVAAFEAQNPDLTAREQLDAETRGEQAFADLCGLIGLDETERLRKGPERPQWFRG
jgi:hypothetical protein